MNVKRLIIIIIIPILIMMHRRKEEVDFVRRFSNFFINVFIVLNENML